MKLKFKFIKNLVDAVTRRFNEKNNISQSRKVSSQLKLNYEGVFLHGIDLNDFHPCNNLIVSDGRISSRDMYGLDPSFSEVHKSIRDMTMKEIENTEFYGVINPAQTYLSIGKDIYNGLTLFQKNLKSDTYEKINPERAIKKYNIELKFEEERRRISPESSSRLNCLFLSEKSDQGELLVRNMFYMRNLFLITVEIPIYFRVTKADSRWLELYYENPKLEYIQKYWSGVPLDSVYSWEYLVEGTIQMNEARELQELKVKASQTLGNEWINMWKALGKV